MVALHNFSDAAATVELTFEDLGDGDQLVDLLVDGRTIRVDDDGRVSIPMDGYGYRWFRVIGPEGKRLG